MLSASMNDYRAGFPLISRQPFARHPEVWTPCPIFVSLGFRTVDAVGMLRK